MAIPVVYWSGTGNTAAMAEAVAKGIEAAGKEAQLIEADSFNAADVANYDCIAFGCSAMGDEVLEEDVFEPMFTEAEGSLSGKKIAIFGSYGWGDGEWMRNWQERCEAAGANLVAEGLIANEYPDDAAVQECMALGGKLAE